MGKRKQIAIGKDISFSDIKSPKHNINPDSFFEKSPSWCFSKIDKEIHKWSLPEDIFLSEIMPKLISFEQRKWGDIIDDSKHNHWISVDSFSKEAQKRASELPQVGDELFSLRLTGQIRLFGFIENGVYYIIWFDLKHEVCPSLKKNT